MSSTTRARIDSTEDVMVGDILIADGGFACIEEGRRCEVKAAPDGDLYVDCCGSECDFRADVPDRDDPKDFSYTEKHFLSGQEEDGGFIGFRKVKP